MSHQAVRGSHAPVGASEDSAHGSPGQGSDRSFRGRARRLRSAPRVRSSAAQSWIALAAYWVASFLLFGIPLLSHREELYLGYGTDPATFMWFLKWWPYAISHGLNPFFTHLLWAPSGFNLAGATAIPGPALIAAPITLAAGPVFAYNVLILVAPALSSWAAYLLFRRVTGRFLPALVGGYLFGFSSYELAKLMGHLNLALTFPVPLAVLLVIRRIRGEIGLRSFTLLLGATLAGQFLISPEISLMLAVFGGATLLLALVFLPSPWRGRLLRTVPGVGLGYALAVFALLPYLYFFFARPSTTSPIYPFYPATYAIDPVNILVPNSVTWVGRHDFAAVATAFSGNPSEQTAYLGLPLLAIVFLFGVTHWRRAWARVLLASLALVWLASFGPVLRVAGIGTIALPWRFLLRLPLVKYALPSRFPLFASLLVAAMAAIWLASDTARWWTKGVMVSLAVLFLLPSLGGPYWQTPLDTPAFFTAGVYRRVLRPGENVLVVPYAANGNSMLWQAQAGMAFRMPEGYLTVTPPKAFADWPILSSFYGGEPIPNGGPELARFLRTNDVTAVVIKDGTPGSWRQVFAPLGAAPAHIAGVEVYRVPPEVTAGPSGG